MGDNGLFALHEMMSRSQLALPRQSNASSNPLSFEVVFEETVHLAVQDARVQIY